MAVQLGPFSWERMIRAVERVKERLAQQPQHSMRLACRTQSSAGMRSPHGLLASIRPACEIQSMSISCFGERISMPRA